MARIVPLLSLPTISVHRFDHPQEHEDQPYEEVAGAFMASFVEAGTFDLAVGDAAWRVRTGDVMLSHPGMRFRADFQGKGFNDTCLSLTYLTDDGQDSGLARAWARAGRPIARASNRLRYLHWGLRRAVEARQPMLAEYCAVEVYGALGTESRSLYRDRTLAWYAERVDAARSRLDREYERQHTVSELARSVGMSMFNFSRVFTDLMGRAPHSYLKEVRLSAARAMLLEGRSVTDTCFACGYNDLSHFSRSFTARFGRPPSRVNG